MVVSYIYQVYDDLFGVACRISQLRLHNAEVSEQFTWGGAVSRLFQSSASGRTSCLALLDGFIQGRQPNCATHRHMLAQKKASTRRQKRHFDGSTGVSL